MRKILFLMAALVLVTVFLAAAPKTDWQNANLYGKVKILKATSETTYFNESGYMDSIINGSVNRYDGDTIYTYDTDNRLISEISHYDTREEMLRITNTYDASGLLIKVVTKDYSVKTDKLEYNAQKQLIWKKTYDEDGSFNFATEYAYDSAGNKIGERDYKKDMKLYYKTIFTYDKDNKLVEQQGYKIGDTDILDQTYTYDADGFVLVDTYYYNGEIEIKHEYSYDEYHNVTNDKIYEMGDFITYSYSYTYDKLGNWLTREETRNGKLDRTQKREIIYY